MRPNNPTSSSPSGFLRNQPGLHSLVLLCLPDPEQAKMSLSLGCLVWSAGQNPLPRRPQQLQPELSLDEELELAVEEERARL